MLQGYATGIPVPITATGDVFNPTVGNKDCTLLGFYVNSTTAGTLVLRQGGASGTTLGGTITPAVGWHTFPSVAHDGLHATVGGAIDVTFFIVPGIL
jgi:hypothetical protein